MLSKEQNGAQMPINLIKVDHGINMTDRRNPFLTCILGVGGGRG